MFINSNLNNSKNKGKNSNRNETVFIVINTENNTIKRVVEPFKYSKLQMKNKYEGITGMKHKVYYEDEYKAKLI